MSKIFIVAHRGSSSKAIENTVESFRLAFQEGADFIEGDFWIIADQNIVCIHDYFTSRITNKTTNSIVKLSTINSLKSINYFDDQKQQRLEIPSLEEVIETIPKGKGLFLEIKDSDKKFIDVLKFKLREQSFLTSNLRIISYQPTVLKYSKVILPEVKTLWIFDYFLFRKKCNHLSLFKRFLQTIKEIKADGVDLFFSNELNETFINNLKNENLEVGIYDVNDEESIKQVANYNIDFLTTDFPALAVQIIRNSKEN